MAADILTKALPRDKHLYCMNKLGMCLIPTTQQSSPRQALLVFRPLNFSGSFISLERSLSGRNYLYSNTHTSDISKTSQDIITKQNHNTTIQGIHSSKVKVSILTLRLLYFSSMCCALAAPSKQLQLFLLRLQLQQLLPNQCRLCLSTNAGSPPSASASSNLQ